MSEYLFCTSDPRTPGVVHIRTSKYDPRDETLEAKLRRRKIGNFKLEWTLLVIDSALSEEALLKALRPHRDRKDKTGFACDPMVARGDAVKLTTLRPDPKKRRKVSLLRRMIRAA